MEKAELFLCQNFATCNILLPWFPQLPAGGELSPLCLGTPVGQFVAQEAPSDSGSVLERLICWSGRGEGAGARRRDGLLADTRPRVLYAGLPAEVRTERDES